MINIIIIIIKQFYKASQLGLDALTIAKNKKLKGK
jgi:hypothetical protein